MTLGNIRLCDIMGIIYLILNKWFVAILENQTLNFIYFANKFTFICESPSLEQLSALGLFKKKDDFLKWLFQVATDS